ncbi:MAG: D-alanine--D-alanine ligase [Thermodesulfobacteriota bacterium]|nr:MAG: D-alanine--D-alanine ligase [Thermodesulfobacteriota bacterium]
MHDRIPLNANFDHQDVLYQSEAIANLLKELRYDPVEISVSLNLKELIEALTAINPSIVFNLVESIEGQGRLIHLIPSILDYLKLTYTGSKTEPLFLTSNKIIAKKLLIKAGILTSSALSLEELKYNKNVKVNGLYIIKSVWEHASQGIDENSVITVKDKDHLIKALRSKENQLGGECIAEQYIEGREFNLSLLASPKGPEVLPPGEIIFEDYPQEKIKIVCYRAKWVEGSFEYLHTPRTFEFSSLQDHALLRRLKKIAKKCWNLFDLHGYARVDFRVDKFDNPFVLEVNANPCISPDSGFVAAAAQTGISMKRVIERIISDAFQPAYSGLSYKISPKLREQCPSFFVPLT